MAQDPTDTGTPTDGAAQERLEGAKGCDDAQAGTESPEQRKATFLERMGELYDKFMVDVGRDRLMRMKEPELWERTRARARVRGSADPLAGPSISVYTRDGHLGAFTQPLACEGLRLLWEHPNRPRRGS